MTSEPLPSIEGADVSMETIEGRTIRVARWKAKKGSKDHVPLLFFNGIWIAWIFVIGSIPLFGSRSFLLQAGIVNKLLGIGMPPLNYPLWFLRDLCIVFVLTPIFLACYRRIPVTGLVALLLLTETFNKDINTKARG